MIGRNDPIKNYPLAFASLAKAMDNSKYVATVIVGISQNEKGIEGLKEKFPERVLVLHELPNTSSLIQRSSILLMTSKKEGSPLVVLEAFCCGKPIVGTNVSGIRDLVQNNYNGMLCNQSAEELAQAIIKLSSDQNFYKNLSTGASAAAQMMDVKQWTESYGSIYRELST